MKRALVAFAVIAWLLPAPRAAAHFLFLRITPPAEAGRAAEVYFSDLPEAGDTRFIDKIAHTKLWLQNSSGKVSELKVHQGEDRLRAVLPATGSLAIVGSCEYGVLPRKVPFLLRHFPKAVDGTIDELNKLPASDKAAVEIAATFSADAVRLVALRDGKPLANVDLFAVGKGLSNVKFRAGADGSATWKPPHAGRFAVYFGSFTKAAGERDGEKYAEVRDFATLTFNWPLSTTGADPKAVALFVEARDARARWEKFPGFHANIAGKIDGRSFKGTVEIKADGTVTLKTDDEDVRPWVRDQLESIVLHRQADGGAKESTPVLRFADHETDHPLGRLLIFEKGRFASSYRVKDKQITVVNRALGKETMTITALDNVFTKEGRYLPRSYTVHYWDAASGTLLRTATVHERWQRVGDFDLPERRTVTSAGPAGLSTRAFALTGHRLLSRK